MAYKEKPNLKSLQRWDFEKKLKRLYFADDRQLELQRVAGVEGGRVHQLREPDRPRPVSQPGESHKQKQKKDDQLLQPHNMIWWWFD